MSSFRVMSLSLASALLAAASAASAQVVELDFQGNAGFGLLTGNEVGPNTSLGSDSQAIGGEVNDGLVLDLDRNVLESDFDFRGLTVGLFDAASGIHFHQVPEGADVFNTNGPIVFNLNSGADAAVTLDTSLVGFGTTAAQVTGSIALTDEDEQAFLDGRFYLNIHSDGFRGGDLRASVVPAGGLNAPVAVPTPGAAAAGLALLGGAAVRRRRRG